MIEEAPPKRVRSRDRYKEQDETLRGRRLASIILGDSLAQPWPDELLDGVLPSPIGKLGAPGDRIQATLHRLATCTPDLSAAKVFVLITGTNNLTDGDSPEEIAAAYTRLIAAVRGRASTATVLATMIPPRAVRGQYRDEDRDRLNALLRELGCPVIETDAMKGQPDFYNDDGLHLKRPAYVWLTQQLKTALQGVSPA